MQSLLNEKKDSISPEENNQKNLFEKDYRLSAISHGREIHVELSFLLVYSGLLCNKHSKTKNPFHICNGVSKILQRLSATS